MRKITMISKSHDPFMNQAIESTLFSEERDDLILFIYTNEPSVFIGRNQNPWKELKLNSNANIKFLRRISGGGTVYHDLMNINFAFIYKEGMTTIKENLELIVNSLKIHNIDLRITNRNDLLYKNKKVSGNAFYRRGKMRLHHGTLLINVATDKLWKCLNFDHESYDCKSISSVRSEIVNLSSINNALTVQNAIMSISNLFEGDMLDSIIYIQTHLDNIHNQISNYSSRAWLYEETPYFEYTYLNHKYKVRHGHIVEADNMKLKDQFFDIEMIKKEVKDVTGII